MCLNKLFVFLCFTGIVRTANRRNLTFSSTYQLEIVAEDSFEKALVSNSTILFVRVATTPSIEVTDVKIGQFQIQTTLVLTELAYLEEVEKLQVLVQRYYPKTPLCEYQSLC